MPMADIHKVETAPGLIFDVGVDGRVGAPLVLLLHGFSESFPHVAPPAHRACRGGISGGGAEPARLLAWCAAAYDGPRQLPDGSAGGRRHQPGRRLWLRRAPLSSGRP